MNLDKAGLDGATQRIIGCAFTVANRLGVGFLERIYENALVLELRKRGISVKQQLGVVVRYDGVIIGEYTPDLVVEDEILVEWKVVAALNNAHFAQCMNYLRATEKRLCLLINFGRPRIEVRRVARHAPSAFTPPIRVHPRKNFTYSTVQPPSPGVHHIGTAFRVRAEISTPIAALIALNKAPCATINTEDGCTNARFNPATARSRSIPNVSPFSG